MTFLCALCGRLEHHQSVQKGVGQGWRASSVFIDMRRLWFCVQHTAVGKELEMTVEISVETMKKNIVESVRARVVGSQQEQ